MQITLDILIAFAISGTFAILIASMSYGMSNSLTAQLSGLTNAIGRASSALNYSIYPTQQFRIERG